MKGSSIRRGVALALVVVALATAMALWLGVFRQERAEAAMEPDLVVTVSSSPAVGTTVASGSVIHYEIEASNVTDADATGVDIDIWVAGGNPTVQAAPGPCLSFAGITTCTVDLPGNTSVTLGIDVEVTAASGSSVYLGAYVDPPSTDHPFGTARESEFGRTDFGDDPDFECSHVGEDEDVSLTLDGIQLEPDNYDCTKHDVAEGAAPTTGVLHNCPQSGLWAISVWDGPNGTSTSAALATCTGASVSAAYSLDSATNAWLRYFAGRPDVSNLLTVDDMEGIITLGQ
jgi:hypothetical protein